jgi:hypothetical protein
MDTTVLQSKMRATRNLNLASLILAAVEWGLGLLFIILSVAAVAQAAANAPSYADEYSAASSPTAGLLIAAGLLWWVVVLVGLASFVVRIIAAVYNNNQMIKDVYVKQNKGTSAPVLAILAIFFVDLVFAIIIWVQTKDVLKAAVPSQTQTPEPSDQVEVFVASAEPAVAAPASAAVQVEVLQPRSSSNDEL